MVRAAVLLIIAAFFIGCGGETPIVAKAILKDAKGLDVGKVLFKQILGEPEVTVTVTITGTSTIAAPGEHGMHMHVGKTCVPPSFMSAGDHWNPLMMMHGHPGPAPHHAGDLGNVTVGPDRTGTMELKTTEMTLLPGDPVKSITGLTVIFHANRDDGVTQMPYGMSGPRLACGVVGP